MSTNQPLVSFVLATHNRQAVVRNTLGHVVRCGLQREDFETIVVDNASDDGTAEAVEALHVTTIRLNHNAGSCAKAHGADRARGRYIVFLDDDSYPRPGSVARMIGHFEEDSGLGAAGFVVHLPDGRLEGGALPDVFVGCGVGLRADALRAAGGLDASFFMQAEEYDLAFRMAGAGWRVRMFDDLHVDHLKSTDARRRDRTTFYDTRNNLRVVARHLPHPYDKVYRRDWLERYGWLAKRDGHQRAYRRGVWAGRFRALVERPLYRRHRLAPAAFEHFFSWNMIETRMMELALSGARRIVFADLGKNVYAFYRAVRAAELTLVAIGDDRLAAPGRQYRGVPVVPLDAALGLDADAIVVANASAVHGTYTYQRILNRLAHGEAPMSTAGPQASVHHWFDRGAEPVEIGLGTLGQPNRGCETEIRPALQSVS
jgi:GT2 family glycosyltransferase